MVQKVSSGFLKGFWSLGFPGCGVQGLGSAAWRGRGLSKSCISRVVIGLTPFRVLITLLITYLLSPLPLQVGSRVLGFGFGLHRRVIQRVWNHGLRFRI